MSIAKYCSYPMCPSKAVPTSDTRHSYCTYHMFIYKDKEKARRANHPRQAIYNTSRWKTVREIVKYRDSYQCQECKWRSPDGKGLVADHILGILNVDDPFDTKQIQTLCLRCSGLKDGQRSNERKV